MNVIVALEHRFEGTPDGKIWTKSTGSYTFWQRYLEVFNTVSVLARVKKVETAASGSVRADGELVSFIQVPHYIGPYQYLLKSVQIKSSIRKGYLSDSAVILRVPGHVSSCLETILKQYSHPFSVEVVGDPYDVFAPGGVKTIFRPFFRLWLSRRLRSQCGKAIGASYVTREALQSRYPCGTSMKSISDVELDIKNQCTTKGFTSNYSRIDIVESSFVPVPRNNFVGKDGFIQLVMVGSLAQLYKAPDVLIDAVHKCTTAGLKIKLNILGDGAFRGQLMEQVAELGISNFVQFLGELTAGNMVRAQLDYADIFVLPSRTEGLPRAMIEAMARALPCIGSTVGGIPELLPPEDMVPPGNADVLASKIREVVTNPARMRRMSERNLVVSQEYSAKILREKRIEFYQNVKEATEGWLAHKELF